MSWQARRPPVSVLADMALRQERVAQRLAELRERHALSQERAAQKVGITHRQWQRWENGQSMPRPGNLGEVALAFGVPVTTFYEEDDASPAADPSQLDRIEKMLQTVTPAATQALRDESRDARELVAMHAKLDDLQEAVLRIEGYLQEQASAAVRERVSRAARQQSKRRDTTRADPASENG